MNTIQYTMNGYQFGERMLEDIPFVVTVDLDSQAVIGVGVDPEYNNVTYLDGLNMPYWLTEAQNYADDVVADVFGSGNADLIFHSLNPDGSLEF